MLCRPFYNRYNESKARNGEHDERVAAMWTCVRYLYRTDWSGGLKI